MLGSHRYRLQAKNNGELRFADRPSQFGQTPSTLEVGNTIELRVNRIHECTVVPYKSTKKVARNMEFLVNAIWSSTSTNTSRRPVSLGSRTGRSFARPAARPASSKQCGSRTPTG